MTAPELRRTAKQYRDTALYRSSLGYREDAVALRIGAKRLESRARNIERKANQQDIGRLAPAGPDLTLTLKSATLDVRQSPERRDGCERNRSAV